MGIPGSVIDAILDRRLDDPLDTAGADFVPHQSRYRLCDDFCVSGGQHPDVWGHDQFCGQNFGVNVYSQSLRAAAHFGLLRHRCFCHKQPVFRCVGHVGLWCFWILPGTLQRTVGTLRDRLCSGAYRREQAALGTDDDGRRFLAHHYPAATGLFYDYFSYFADMAVLPGSGRKAGKADSTPFVGELRCAP